MNKNAKNTQQKMTLNQRRMLLSEAAIVAAFEHGGRMQLHPAKYVSALLENSEALAAADRVLRRQRKTA